VYVCVCVCVCVCERDLPAASVCTNTTKNVTITQKRCTNISEFLTLSKYSWGCRFALVVRLDRKVSSVWLSGNICRSNRMGRHFGRGGVERNVCWHWSHFILVTPEGPSALA
jgi:hypothetical protein